MLPKFSYRNKDVDSSIGAEVCKGGMSSTMKTYSSLEFVSVVLLAMTVFHSNVVFTALQDHDQRIVVGIVCCDMLTSTVTQRINATWWAELENPLRTKSGLRVKVDLVFLSRPSSTTLSSARQVSRLLKQESISLLVGPDDLLLRMVSSDQQIPLIAVSAGMRQEGLEAAEGGSETESAPLPSSTVTLQLMPRTSVFHRAVIDVVRTFLWENVAIIYDSTEGLDLIGLLMEETEVTIRAWHISSRANEIWLRDQLLQVRFLEMRHVVVVVCQPDLPQRLLSAALRLSMLSLRYSWVFVHPLPSYINDESFGFTGVNLAMFSLLSQDALKLTTIDENQMTTVDDHQMTKTDDRLINALIDDSLRLLTMTLKTMSSASESANSCSAAESASAGCIRNKTINISDLVDNMRQGSLDGLTGNIQFDSTGCRTSAVFRVFGLNSSGIEEIGEWSENGTTSSNRLQIRKWTNQSHHLSTRPLQRTVNHVVTVIDPPFVMLKKNHEVLSGNDRFEGFLVELFDRIAQRLNFRYELYESPDGNYGSKDASGNWNGMIRELIIGNASMCLGAISITSDREEVVDFSKPFKQKMFNFLMKKPEAFSTIFQFLSPLSTTVWLAILSGLVLVSLLLFLMDRASPNFPNRRTAESSDARLGLSGSIWFMYGALVGGGTEGWTPRTASCRLLTSAWWFFGLIIISSYTANLAAFLTVTRIETPIKSISDLSTQTLIRYGTVRNTYAMSMFRNSQLEILQKMWLTMSVVHPDSMVNNTKQGIEKAQKGDYAFIWDAPINKHIAMHDCSVISTGEPFDEKGYGIGVPMGASYRDNITMAILSLGEKGEIVKMENRWWGNGECADFAETSTGNNEELNMFNVAGVFLLLAFGAVLASVACLIEYVTTRVAASKKTSTLKHDNSANKVQDLKMSPMAESETAM